VAQLLRSSRTKNHRTLQHELLDDPKFVAEVERIGRKKLVIAALWTEVCLAFPAIDACAPLRSVCRVDASGGMSKEIHDTAVMRLVQAGVVPVTWVQVMLEWQRDWRASRPMMP